MARKKFTSIEFGLMQQIARNLKSIMTALNISQKKLSQISTVPSSTISDYINEVSLMSHTNLELIANALGVDKESIYPNKSEETNSGTVEILDLINKDLTYKGRALSQRDRYRLFQMIELLLD